MSFLGQLGQTAASAGATALGGGLAGAAVSGLTSLLSGDQSKKAYQYQQKLQNSQNAWQAEQNRLAEQYQSQEWQRQFDATNAYNDPSAQVQRLIKAGLNPATLNGSTASGNSAASVTGNSGHNTGYGVGNLGAPIAGMQYDNLNAISNAIKSLTGGVRDLSSAKETNTLLREKVRNLISQTSNTEAQSFFTNLQSKLLDKFGSKKEQALINNFVAQTAKEYAAAEQAYSQAKDLDALEKLHSQMVETELSKKANYEADTQLKGRMVDKASVDLKYLDAWYVDQLNLLKAEAQDRLASARNTGYEADAKQLHAEIMQGLRNSTIARNDYEDSIRKGWSLIKSQVNLTDEQTNYVNKQSKYVGKQTSEYELWNLLNFAESVGMAAAVGGLFKGAKVK